MILRRMLGVATAAALLIAACGGGTGGSPAPSMVTEIGAGEGVVTTLNWAGYVEDGSTYPEYDWVTEFEENTGCDVQAQPFGTSDEAYSLMTTNPEQFDVISASGDAAKRLALGGFTDVSRLHAWGPTAWRCPAARAPGSCPRPSGGCWPGGRRCRWFLPPWPS